MAVKKTSERAKRPKGCAGRTESGADKRYRALLEFLPDPVMVVDLKSSIIYLNPAFTKVFGWSMNELEGRLIPFIPEHLREETRNGIKLLFREKIIHNYETKRLTKDGRYIDVLLNAALYYEKENEPSGQIIILRDVTKENRTTRRNEALHRVAKVLPQYQSLNERLEFIIKEVQDIVGVTGASVILLDEKKKEFFFRQAVYEDGETDRRIKEVRFPADKGVAGHVYKTGRPMIVTDYPNSPYYFGKVDEQSGYKTRNMLDVPISMPDRIIGILCAVNKKEGEFDDDDLQFLSAIAGTVASPIENARINEELKRSYEDVKSLNRAKDRVIHHLSHELKTPVSVLSASLALLTKRLSGIDGMDRKDWKSIMERSQRSLKRILEMQYEIEDILRERNYSTYNMLLALLDSCADEIEALAALECGNENIVPVLRNRIEEIFGPRDSLSEEIFLDEFVGKKMRALRSRFEHRRCRVEVITQPVPAVLMPGDVVSKIFEGLVRNAVANTPDGGKISVSVVNIGKGPRLVIKDSGIGITEENRRLIFESNFTARETMRYSSKQPYDFYAGGKGFDLLRMKIFSEKYGFDIDMTSSRCRFIPKDDDICPGDIINCAFCESEEDCFNSGGTCVVLQFAAAGGDAGKR